MIGLLAPTPTLARQDGSLGSQASFDQWEDSVVWPSRVGPRQNGQSAAGTADAKRNIEMRPAKKALDRPDLQAGPVAAKGWEIIAGWYHIGAHRARANSGQANQPATASAAAASRAS